MRLLVLVALRNDVQDAKIPSTRIRFCFKMKIFFLRFSLPFTCFMWKLSLKTNLFKRALQSEDLWKYCLLVYEWTDENGGFLIRWCHTSFTTSITHALWGMLSYFHCFCFGMGGRKRFEYAACGCVFFWKGTEKSPFSKISGYVWTVPKSGQFLY